MGATKTPARVEPDLAAAPSTGPAGAIAADGAWFILILVLLGAAYFGMAKIGLALAFQTEQVSAVWPPAGVALAGVLLFGFRAWPAIFVGAFLANVTAHEPALVACGVSAGNTLEALISAWLIRRFIGAGNPLDNLKGVLFLAGVGATIGPAIAASVGVSSLCLGRVEPVESFASLWRLWWLGDATGALVFAPVILAWCRPVKIKFRLSHAVEAAALAAGMLGMSLYFVPGRRSIFPFVIWATLRFGERGVTGVILVHVVTSIWFAMNGQGSFVTGPTARLADENLLALQLNLAAFSVTGLLLAAVISERKRAEERLAALNASLELRIAERTAEVRLRAAQLTKLASELTNAEQRERQRLAVALHDELAQSLALSRMKLSMIESQAPSERKEHSIREIKGYLTDAVQFTRSLMHDLRPPSLFEVGLAAALRGLAENMKQKHGLEVTIESEGLADVDPELRGFLYQSVKELLTNAVKYGQTQVAAVTIRMTEQEVSVTVEDQGVGFDIDKLAWSPTKTGGFGLFNIRERAMLLGGGLEVRSKPGQGDCASP